MNKLTRIAGSLLISSTLFLVSCGGNRTDAEIQTDVTAKLTDEEGGKMVNATVSEGVVTLTGECKDDECRKGCAEEVKEVNGVKEVVNNIQIASAQPAMPPADESAVDVAPDNTLSSSINEAVGEYKEVKAEVKDGVVTLRGEIKRSELPELMQKISTLKVRRIDNQLVIN